MITTTMTKPSAKLAMEAVMTDEAASKSAWSIENVRSGMKSITIANTEAINPTTMP
jgi:hypothetical protein